MRRLGWTYGEIMETIPVAKGTLAGWCRAIELTPNQIDAISQRQRSQSGIPRDTQKHRRREVEQLAAAARAQVPILVSDPLWVAGLVLYWGEGSKTGSRLQLSNADPRALGLFREWCMSYHGPVTAFSAALNLHDDNDVDAARDWWARKLHLSAAAFTKPYLKPAGTGHRTNHLPYGVCRLTLRRSADALHRTLAWIDELPQTVSPDAGGSLDPGR
ncbi:MAG: hypothetical protein M3349_05075 [Actinomycetota bacterium]|nr:hypothetical protein [Actinomycetota bacterium]